MRLVQNKLWILTVAAGLLASACTPPPRIQQETLFAFGTIIDITVYDVDEQRARQLFTALEDDFNYIHNTWHAWKQNALYRVNSLLATGARFSQAPSIQPLIDISTELSAKSNGLFNPAIGKLIDLWGFHSDELPEGPPPETADIAALVAANPRMSDIKYDGMLMYGTNPDLRLDFGAVAKGYGIDLAMQHAAEMGVHNIIINAGGDLRARGNKGKAPWHIGIRDPRGEGVLASLDTRGDESVFTSGDYERYFEYDGKRYHHIIDPRNGYPANNCRSVTIIHEQAAVADAAATALFIAGPEEWYAIAKQMGIKFVMLVDQEGSVHMNPAMAERIHFETKTLPRIFLSPPL